MAKNIQPTAILASFRVSSASLLKPLLALSAVAKPNPAIPVYEGVLLEYYGLEVLHLTATNGETTLSQRLAVAAGTDRWRTVVPLAKLLDTLKMLPDQPLVCAVHAPVEAPSYGRPVNRLHLQSSNGLFQLACLDEQDWPTSSTETEEPFSLHMHVGELQAALAGTVPVVSTDELRPAMTGVLVEVTPERLCFVATDGHRLNRWKLNTREGVSTRKQFIIPGPAAKLLLGLLKNALGEVDLLLTAGRASVQMVSQPDQGWGWHCRLIADRYPDYENVIPLSLPSKLLIPRQALRGALSRLSAYAGHDRAVRLRLDEQQDSNQVEVWAQDLDFAREAHEQVGCFYAGATIEIGFDAQLLQGQLALLPGDELQVQMSSPSRACLLYGSGQNADAPELMALIMPLILTGRF